MRQRTVFICRDFLLAPILDRIARELTARGIEIIRGPDPTPGAKLVYAPDTHERLFARAEVMMFSSRSVGSRAVLEAAPGLRGIVNPTIGLETVDLAAANDLGLIVGHGATPENYLGMAEATVMLMLVLSYQLHRTERVLRENLPRPEPDPERAWGRMLRGRTVGLVGLGRVGRAVAERLHGFDVTVLAHDPYIEQRLVPAGVALVDLDALVAASDIVSLHVALPPATPSVIGARELGLMKPTAYLINTARGEALDEDAVYRALQERRIAGAALDNFVVEPLPTASPLRALDNVVLTPHMVGHTRDVFASFVPAAVENITRILAGAPPLYCKNPEILPRWRERLARLGA